MHVRAWLASNCWVLLGRGWKRDEANSQLLRSDDSLLVETLNMQSPSPEIIAGGRGVIVHVAS